MTTTCRQEFAGHPRCLREVREFVAKVLAGTGWEDDAMLLASEVAANAVEHTDSCGKTFSITVTVADDHARLEVIDLGGTTTLPCLLADGRADGTRGRGIALVDALALAWGIECAPPGLCVWVTVGTPAPTLT